MSHTYESIVRDEAGNIIERRILTSRERIRCEICQEVIATIDKATIEAPIRGDMFDSPDPGHGFLPPFGPDANLDSMFCPYCLKRPFLVVDPESHVILTLESHARLNVMKKEPVPEDLPPEIIQESMEQSTEPVESQLPASPIVDDSRNKEKALDNPTFPVPSSKKTVRVPRRQSK